MLAASCATVPPSFYNDEARFAEPKIYLEADQFLWTDAVKREQLACTDGTPVICTSAQNRLAPAFCGCRAQID